MCKHGAEVFVPLSSVTEEKKPEPEVTLEPAKTAEPEKKKGFVCGICGYVLESDTLPDDYICPICSNPASAFKPIE